VQRRLRLLKDGGMNQIKATVGGPAAGSRPRNRRMLILQTAAALFAERGYEKVGMSEIAEAVAVRPSAIYGHFSGKQDLLYATILAEFAPARTLVADLSGDGLDSVLRGLAGFSLDHRGLGVLWQRESRHLDDRQRADLRNHIRDTVTTLAGLLREQRAELATEQAELLVQCTLSVLLSSGQHRLMLPRPGYDLLMADLCRAVLAVRPPATPGRRPAETARHVLALQSRRESLLEAATSLFAARGYTTTSVDDIGAAAGIAGPSVYNHFGSKADLLATAVTRAIGGLRIDLSRVLRSCTDPGVALVALGRAYRDFAFVHSALIDVVVAEASSLPAEQQRETRQAIREYVGEWVHLLHAAPGVQDVAARIRVMATLSMINDVARTPHLRVVAGIDDILDAAAAGLLVISEKPEPRHFTFRTEPPG
jgi:AcrR family transcriptional regulator